jgi:hypothetical protein
VLEGRTGTFFDVQDPDAIVEAIIKFKPEDFQPDILREHARKFDVSAFKRNFEEMVAAEWRKFCEGEGKAGFPR